MTIVGLVPVHDESQTIKRALDSFGKVCDELVVLDVGGTDGAIEIVRDMGVEVVDHPWKTYAKANECMLDVAKDRGDYALLFGSTETVEQTEPMPEILDAPKYVMKMVTHGAIIRSDRMFDTSIEWTCPEPVHANIQPHFFKEQRELTALTIWSHDDDGRRAGKLERYRDELEAWLLDHPEDARSTYYLATTYYFLGCKQAALGLFQRRARMTSGDVEAWHANYMAGGCLMEMDFVEGAKMMIECLRSHPDRMEPVFTLEHALHQIRERFAMPTEGVDLNWVNPEAYLG